MSSKLQSVAFGDFVFDGDEKVLRHGQKPVPITPKAFHLLQTLIENRGRLVEKEQLIATVWPDSVVEEGNLSFTMALLRKALGDNRKEPRFIETVSKRGYRFIGQIEPFQTAPPRPAAESLPAPKGHRRLVLTAVPMILLITIFGAGFAWLLRDARPAEGRVKLVSPVGDGKITNAVVTPDGKQLVFSRKDGSGEGLWRKDIGSENQTQLIPSQPVEYVGLSVSPKNDFAYFSIFSANNAVPTLTSISLSGGPTEPLTDITTDASVTFSPDGDRIAFTDSISSLNETYLKTANADGSNQRTLLTVKGPDRYLPIFRASPAAWSPDGKTIAVAIRESDERGYFYRVLLIDPENGSQSSMSNMRWNAVTNIAWLRNSDLVLIDSAEVSSKKNVWQVSVETGERRKLNNESSDFEWLSVSGGRVYTVQKETHSSIYVAEYDAPAKDLRSKQIYAEANSIDSVAWTSNGQILFNSHQSGNNEIWRIGPDGTSQRQITLDSGLGDTFAVSPADDSLMFSANKEGRTVLISTDASGQNVRQLTDGPYDINPSLSADGRSAVFQRQTGRSTLWSVNLSDGQPAVQITGYFAVNPEYSSDGKLISFHFMDYDGGDSKWKLGLIDSVTRRLVKKLDFPVPITNRKTAWAPGAGLVTLTFAAGDRGAILLIDPLTGSHHVITDVGTGGITSLAWSRDGQSLVFAQKHQITDVVELAGTF